ncbi:MAG: chromate efflux transporter [Hyphomonadaceae bacterium]
MSANPSLAAFTAASLRVGCLGFGGPAGQIALMHRIFVTEKRWVDEARYLYALNYCMLLPGPEAQQLATYIGWLLHGVRGGLIAGTLFVLPGALIVFALSWLYVAHGQAPLVMALFYGVKAAVLGFVVDALARIAQRALKSWLEAAIAAAALLALYLFGAPFPLVILASLALGLLAARGLSGAPLAPDPAARAQPSAARALRAGAVWLALWLAPLAIVLAVFGEGHVLAQVGLLFSQLALISFGGAYALLAYLQQQAVDGYGWLTQAQMIDGLGLAETTPGPLVLVNQYVGFLAGWREGGFALAAAGAALATWCTMAPSFAWIFAGAPFAERLRRSAYAQAALRAVTAAALGIIAALALWFAQHVIFRENTVFSAPWGRSLDLPLAAAFDPIAALIAVFSATALIRFKANAALVVLAAAVAGWVASLAI